MKDYNRNQNQNDVHQWTPKETVDAIQNVSKNIREYSFRMRETMKTLRESGAIPEMADAIKGATFAVRDTVNDINETTKDLKQKNVFVETAGAIEHTLTTVEDSVATVKELTTGAVKASPHASKVIHDGLDLVKKETPRVTGKVMKGFKTKVGVS